MGFSGMPVLVQAALIWLRMRRTLTKAVARAEHRQAMRRHRAFGQGRFAADIVEAAVERLEILRMALQDLVVNGDGADDAGQAAAGGAAQAQEADDIA